jgi:lipoprotein-releasing system ATP-binding protein
MAEAAPLLVARGLEKCFPVPGGPGRLEVLRGIDLRIEQGEMVSVVGQSGVGKSTLLQILGTLDRPTRGQVLYRGEDIFRRGEGGLAGFRNRAIGFVFQFHHLLPEFTALENVMLPGLIAGDGQRRARERAAPLLAGVGLAERLGHKSGELSGGEQQRVAIARALVMSPSVVFMDEPTGNLDTATSEEIHHLLVTLNHSTGTAFVVVTHNVRLAFLMQRHLLLEGGLMRELAAEETPASFLPRSERR